MEESNKRLEMLEKFLERRQYSKSTIDLYKMHLSQFSKFYENIPLEDITLEDIQNYIGSLINRRKLSIHTVHQAAHAFITIFNGLFNKKFDFKALTLPKREYQLQKVLTPDEIIELLNNAPNQKIKLVFATMYSAGLLINELFQLRLKDVDFKNFRLLIRIRMERFFVGQYCPSP
jgi:integrase/recombinase XerD